MEFPKIKLYNEMRTNITNTLTSLPGGGPLQIQGRGAPNLLPDTVHSQCDVQENNPAPLPHVLRPCNCCGSQRYCRELGRGQDISLYCIGHPGMVE